MAKKHTELNLSPDGPWLTIRDGDVSLTLNLREIIRGQMFAAGPTSMKRTMAAWLKARDAEGKPEAVQDPPPENERKPIPASRRIPPRTAKT
jgi:hypothetical protein